jgi:hypothetical protein
MRRAAVCAAALVIATGSLLAQAPANFAGKWTLVPDPNAGGGRGGMGSLSQEATIVQDAKTLTITRTTQMGEMKTTHNLDGSESKNTVSFNGNSMDQLSKAKWDGGALTINTSMNLNGTPVETTMKLSLDPSGNLIVESTRPDFQGGGAPITSKFTYKKN